MAVQQPQLIQQMPEVGRQTGGFGNEVLPQPVSDSFADRRAGRAVDRLVSVAISVGHCGFRFAFNSMQLHQVNSDCIELFPILAIACFFSKY
jgi:hypothetical protein